MTQKINVLNSYNANDIRRRQSTGRRYVIDKTLEHLYKEIGEAADNNYDSVRVDFDCVELMNYNLSSEVLRAVRNHFEAQKFTVLISVWRGYFLIKW